MAATVKIFDIEKPKLGISLSYWQLAAISAVPLGLGLGVWLYYRNRNKSKDSVGQPVHLENGVIEKKKTEQTTQTNQKPKPADTVQVEPPKTPLQRAQSIKDAGNSFFKEGKYSDAIRCYSEAIELCPETETTILSTFYQNRAACHDQMNNLAHLVDDCTKALELNPKYTKALSRRAKAYQSLGKLTESLEDVTAVCILESFQNTKTLEMADFVLKALGKARAKEAMVDKPASQPSHYFVKNYFSSFPNDPVVNAADFEVVEVNEAVTNGESSKSQLEKAKYLLVRGLYEDVIPACTAAVELGEGLEPEALLLRATMYLLQGQHDLALNDLNKIIESQVQNNKITVNALIKRASLYLQTEQREKTFQDFEVAEALDPNNPDIFLHRGQVNLLTDNLDQSLKDFKKCVTLDPDFAIGVMQGHYAEYRRAVQGGSMTGIAKVIEKFKRDIRKHPKCTESYILLAQILMDQQQFDEAENYFKSAIEMDPLNANLRVHRGLLHLQWKGDIDSAISMINGAIKVDDKCSFCYETLGTIEVQRANLKTAVELFDKAIPLAKTELELSHIFSLRDAAKAQQTVAERLGLSNLIGT